MNDRTIKTSKFLSLVLRHQPEVVGLSLDKEGWVEIDALLAAMTTHGKAIDRRLLMEVVADNDKKRFTISDDGLRIRAAQGHSTTTVEMSREAMTPPAALYHGTATRFLDSIREQGLKPGSRHHVHLSPDVPTATAVGKRHGKPVILRVDTAAMAARGLAFYQADNGVWLTTHVPPEFLTEEA